MALSSRSMPCWADDLAIGDADARRIGTIRPALPTSA
jgi:hypothetical protein